jgi:peroxiredoxin
MLSAGDPAPATSVPTGGGPTLVSFFKISCPVCQYTFPFLERLSQSGKVTVVGVSQNNQADTEDFKRAYGLTFPVVLDPADEGYRASNAYQITHVPSLFLVENGLVSMAVSGFSRADLEELGSRFGAQVFLPGESTPQYKPG